ncbi:MAG: hypothetical protein J6Q48_06355 [Bacteroidaceae bacterium]|nr:hypothetical protein [Bacteroidaceae bacterium]
MIIAIDFDGTIVNHEYPEIGSEIPFATTYIRKLIEEQHQVILWTVRRGKLLQDAVEWCKERGIEFYAVNKSFPEEEAGEEYAKVNADIFIDDRNIGGLPDWGNIYKMIKYNKTWKDIYSEKTEPEPQPKKRRRWF